MFWRAWFRSLAVKRPQSALAFAALALGATVASLLLNLYGDARRKMQGEFRAYGPNVVAAPAATSAAPLTAAPPVSADPTATSSALNAVGLLDSGTVVRIQSHIQESSRSIDPSAASAVSVPVLYAVVSASRTPSAGATTNLVAVGADLAALHALNPAWKLSFASNASLGGLALHQCLMGAHAAERLGLKPGDALELASSASAPGPAITGSQSEAVNVASAQPDARRKVSSPLESTAAAEPQAFTIAGLVSSGGPEDDQVFLPLDSLQQLMRLSGKMSLVEMRLPGAPGEVDAEIRDLSRTFPSVEVRPVREIMQSEGKVLGTIQALLLALAALILGVVILCVMATVTTILLHRRKEVAVMKALGATDRAVFALLLAEIVALGIAGGLVGFAAGALLARRVGVDLFGVALNTDWGTALPVLVATVLVAALPALLPVSTVRSIEPARALKGE